MHYLWRLYLQHQAFLQTLLIFSFNSKVKNVIDDIAPVKICKKNGRQKSPWRKSTAVQSMKRQCRKAERMWWKTKLEIHHSIYKDSLPAFNVELATARQTFFSNLINRNLNNTLFATVELLSQFQKEVNISVFEAIDSKILEEIVQHLKSSTCYLDTLPTSFFKSVFNCLEADLLKVVNASLLSGTFPNSMKLQLLSPF